MTLVVMAAGRGSRFGGMKQVAQIGPSGESLFDYAVYDARRSGFDEVVFVVSEASAEAVSNHVESGCGRHVPSRFVVQKAEGRVKPWGTGHAVLTACEEIDGPFAVVNADDFYGAHSFELLGKELPAGTDHVLIAFRLDESLSENGGVSRGICEVEDGMLASIREVHGIERKGETIVSDDGVEFEGSELISANLWGFQPSFRQALAGEFERFLADHGDDADAEFRIGDAVDSLGTYGDERVRVVPTTDRFTGVTFAEDLPRVKADIAGMVDAGAYPARLWD
ncbi:MAG: NTP transferase domain-containing protein [Actinomycetota bacterium]|nr:NTP transferase domain-containing protein [Actinomycetota bacterium]